MNTFASILGRLSGVFNMISVLIVALGVVSFLYGLLMYMVNSGDVAKREESRKYIVYGVIGLFVMTSMWGLVYLLTSFIGEGIAIPLLVG